jgi:hypothetical protein
VHHVTGFLRRGLAFFLISLLALLVGNLPSAEPVLSKNQRFKYHDDIQALALSLPRLSPNISGLWRTFSDFVSERGIIEAGYLL